MEISLEELQTLMDFTEADLKANRRGKLSRNQLDTLQVRASSEFKALLLMPAMITFSLLFFLDIMLALPVLFVIGAIGFGVMSLYRNHLQNLDTKTVEKVSGTLQKTLPAPDVLIDEEVFTLPPEAYEQIPEDKYHVYIISDTRHMLSIEPARRRRKRRSQKKKKSSK